MLVFHEIYLLLLYNECFLRGKTNVFNYKKQKLYYIPWNNAKRIKFALSGYSVSQLFDEYTVEAKLCFFYCQKIDFIAYFLCQLNLLKYVNRPLQLFLLSLGHRIFCYLSREAVCVTCSHILEEGSSFNTRPWFCSSD